MLVGKGGPRPGGHLEPAAAALLQMALGTMLMEALCVGVVDSLFPCWDDPAVGS